MTSPPDDAPSRVPPSDHPSPRRDAGRCGALPPSTGPLARLARLTVDGPASAASGEEVRVSATVTMQAGGPRTITTPATSALLVLRGDRVVARAAGDRTAPHVPLLVVAGAARPAQAVPASVRLVECGVGAGAIGAALPAGRYALVAVLGYQADSLNAAADGGPTPPTGARGFTLVSAPAPITVR